jgi:hypothetical protein
VAAASTVRRLISSLRVFPCHIADPLFVAQLNEFAPDVINHWH